MPITDTLPELVRAGIAISAMASWVTQPDLEKGSGDEGGATWIHFCCFLQEWAYLL